MRAQDNHVPEANGLPELNAQSPSQRWDGDCALSSGLTNRFGNTIQPGTSGGIVGSGSRRTATEVWPAGCLMLTPVRGRGNPLEGLE